MSERTPSPAEPLHGKYPMLHREAVVEHAVTRRRRAGERIPNEPTSKLAAWLETLEGIYTGHGRTEQRQAAQPQVLERIKESYHKKYVTGTDDASVERYLRHQAQVAEEQGHGYANWLMGRATEQVRADARETIRSDQERSLDAWLDYLTSDDATYPMWFKYYTFRNITRLAEYDKQKGEFPKRSKSTTAPFPDINREALAYMEDSLAKHYGLKDIDLDNPAEQITSETQALLDRDANFASLYKRAIEYAAPKHAESLNVTDGQWIKYEQTDDEDKSKELAHSLHGYGTGWCTAGEGMAHSQLSGGDFYVYYTKSEDGQYSVPRAAIRMQNQAGQQHIAEVRGVEANQNMEEILIPIVDAKLVEIDPQGAEHYKKVSADMAHLTEIFNLLEPIRDKETNKVWGFEKSDVILTPGQLQFLYEIDNDIEGFGYDSDPRISLIKKYRNPRADLSSALHVPPERISLTPAEASSGNSIYHYGDLNLNNVYIAEGLHLPEAVSGSLSIVHLRTAEGLHLPKKVGGNLDLRSLTTAEGLHLPETIGRSLYLNGLTTAEGLHLPETIGESLYLNGLTTAEGLHLPETIGWILHLNGLITAEGLHLPETFNGGLHLNSLTTAEGLHLPEAVSGSLSIVHLRTAEGLHLPKKVGGNLDLRSLTTAEGLHLPETIGRSLYLNGLTTAEGLHLPETIGVSLHLNSLTTAEGLHLPEQFNGELYLERMNSADIAVLIQQYPQLADNIY